MTYALVPAAGLSRRMGRPKLALPLGGRTVLEHLLAALRVGGIDRVVVVFGPHTPELVPLAEGAGAEVCVQAETTAHMRDTVEHGLRWLEERYRPRSDDTWLLAPADLPALDAHVVWALRSAHAAEPWRSVVVPLYEGRRGHPALLTWRHADGIRAHPAGEGINVYLRRHADETLELPVAGSAGLLDLDTPEDYDRLLRSWPAVG
jgi:molybdenum cofactor cytidylyltransferase